MKSIIAWFKRLFAPDAAPAAPTPVAASAPGPVADPVQPKPATVPPPGTPAANASAMTLAWLNAGHENQPAAQAQPQPSAPSAENRWDGKLELAYMEKYWGGNIGSVSDFPMPVPAGWKGSVGFMIGESSQAGAKVDQFDVRVTTAAGVVLGSVEKTGYASLAVTLSGDEGSLTVSIKQYAAGGGFIKVNPLPA